MPSIQNTKILVIGGSGGIGYGVAEKCLTEGAAVRIASSNPSRVEESVKSLQGKVPNGQITGHVCDLAQDDVETKLEQLLSTIGELDHIVFTAGDTLHLIPLDNINLEAIHRAGHIRFAVPLLLGKLAPRYLKPGATSSITLTTGSVAEKPLPGWSLVAGYATGLNGLTRSLALDLKPLRVNIVSPGPVSTSLLDTRGGADTFAKYTALGKVGNIEELAEAYVYLMKDTNATGSCVHSNSGVLLM